MLFFQLLGPKTLVSSLTSLILSLPTSNLSGSPVSSSFKIYPESNHSHQFHCSHPGPSPPSLSAGSLQMLPAGITVSSHDPVENILSRALVKIVRSCHPSAQGPPDGPQRPIQSAPTSRALLSPVLPYSPFPLSAPALQAPCCPPDPRGTALLRDFAPGSSLCRERPMPQAYTLSSSVSLLQCHLLLESCLGLSTADSTSASAPAPPHPAVFYFVAVACLPLPLECELHEAEMIVRDPQHLKLPLVHSRHPKIDAG